MTSSTFSATSAAPRVVCSDARLACELRRLLDDCEVIQAPHDCSHAPLCGWLEAVDPHRASRMQHALSDAVATLERTRHAFRSRELGQLRQRLEQLLVELSAPPE